MSNVHAPLTLPSLSLPRLYRIDAYLIRHVAELKLLIVWNASSSSHMNYS